MCSKKQKFEKKKIIVHKIGTEMLTNKLMKKRSKIRSENKKHADISKRC